MRKWIKLIVETHQQAPEVVQRAAAGDWPSVLHGKEIAEMIVFIEASAMEGPKGALRNFALHWEEELEHSQNWGHLMADGLVAKLQTVEIASIDLPEFGCADPEVANDYAQLTSKAPPVLIVGNSLQDGNHRIEAARQRGETHVLAYVVSATINEALRADHAGPHQNYLKLAKISPFALSYIDSGFKRDYRPQIWLCVDIKPYKKTPEIKELLATLRAKRFEIRHTKYGEQFPMEQRTGPYCVKEITFEEFKQIWANRDNSPYGAYQPSRSGYRTVHEENYDERGVGFHISVMGMDPRAPDKYGHEHRQEDHIVDNDKDYQEVVDMFAAIERARSAQRK